MEELVQVEEDTKRNKIMKHIRENRKMYITGAACFGAGITVTLVYCLVTNKFAKITINNIHVDTMVKDDVGIDGDHNTVNLVKTISKYGNPLGRRGNAVREIDPETGRTLHEYASQKLATYDVGCSAETMRKNLTGEISDINGRIFEHMNLEWIQEPDVEVWDY